MNETEKDFDSAKNQMGSAFFKSVARLISHVNDGEVKEKIKKLKTERNEFEEEVMRQRRQLRTVVKHVSEYVNTTKQPAIASMCCSVTCYKHYVAMLILRR